MKLVSRLSRNSASRASQMAALAAAALLLLVSSASAQPGGGFPNAKLNSIFPGGGKQGATLEVNIAGVDLEDANKLHFSDPAITAVPKTTPPAVGQSEPQPVAGAFMVTIKADAKPGVCEARAVGKYGASNPRAFVVGTQNEINETEPNNTLKQANEVTLGTIVNGRSNAASDQDYFKFTATKGQRVIIDCWAYRLDSRMDATLVLYNDKGEELERNRDTNRRDALIDFLVSADGQYAVEIHDFLYTGSNDHFYRLSIGVTPYIDFVYPPAGLPGVTGQFTIFGRNLPGGQPSPYKTVEGKPLEMAPSQIALPGDATAQNLGWGALVEPTESGLDAMEFRLNSPQGASNPVLIGFATAPVILEQEPNDNPAKAQTVSPPCEYVGQFYPRGDQDWLSFNAKQGEVYWIEVFSQRLGLPTDPIILVQRVTKNDKGEAQVQELQSSDDLTTDIKGFLYDMTSDDPVYKLAVPADGEYRVLVRNLYSSSPGDPRSVYRLAIHPAKPDFRLVALPRTPITTQDPNQSPPTIHSTLVRKGGADAIDVMAFRRDGFDGEIRVTVEGLPAGVAAAPLTIGPGQNGGTLVLVAAENAAEGMGVATLRGKAKIGDVEVERPVRTAAMMWGGAQRTVAPRFRMTRDLTVAVSGSELAPFAIDMGTAAVEICRAGKVSLPVKVTRRGDFKGVITLTAYGLGALPNTTAKLTVDAAKSDGVLEFTVPPNAPLGAWSFFLLGTSQINYARNPEAAKTFADRKAAVDKMLPELQKASQQAAAEKAKTEKETTDAKAAAMKAVADQKAAEKAIADADTAAKAAKAKADAAQGDAKPPADKAAEEAAAKSKMAVDAKPAADKAVADTAALVQTTEAAKVAAAKTATEAEAKLKVATEQQANFAKQATDATAAAKPKNMVASLPSGSVTLTVTAAPITLAAAPLNLTVKQGEKIDIPVNITRLYSHADPVQVKATMPGGVAGLAAPPATIAKDQSAGALVLQTAKQTPAGKHTINVQAVAKMNGSDLPVSQDVVVTVEAAP